MLDTRTQETAFDVKAKLQKVDANQLLSAATSVKQVLFGTLVSDIDVHAAPKPGQELASSLNGTVKLQLNDGRLAGIQLLNEVANVARFLGYAKRNENFTNILKLAGTLKIDNGVANTDDLMLQFDGGSLAAAGSVGLADQQLKLRLTTVLEKALSQQAGGSQIGGFMSTALANAKGELVIPALLSGTFAKPRFEPDPARIAKMKLEGLLPTQDNPNSPLSKLSGILGAIGGDKGKQSAAPAAPGVAAPQQQPAGAKKGILDLIDSVRKNAEKK
jgi:uncharacterized protein involved in outer membrane biogenesis